MPSTLGIPPSLCPRLVAVVLLLGAASSCGGSSSKANNSQTTANAPTSSAASSSVVSSAVQTTPATTTAPKPKDFVSDKYKFAVTMTDAWAEVDATIDWDGQHISGPGSPQMANIDDFNTDRTLMGASAAVPPGTPLADWQAAMVRGTPGECTAPTSVETTTLGGEPALIWSVKCSDGIDATHIAALHGGKGWVFYMGSAAANDDAEDQKIFDQARQSFRFTA